MAPQLDKMEDQKEAIANLTLHQNIMDALLNTMAECMAGTGAYSPIWWGQDVLKGIYAIRGELIPKLPDTARDAVSGANIRGGEDSSRTLKESFTPNRTHSYYRVEIQGIWMKKGQTVRDHHTRVKNLV